MDEFLHNKGWLRAIPFALLFAYCLTIYQFVPVMYDDYFFGSLSAFSVTEPDVVATNFTFSQLIHFASVLYKTRLTRVLALVLINAPLLRVQWLYRIIHSLGITMVFYGIYSYSGAKKTILNAFAAITLFGLFSQRMLTEGAFWFTSAMVTFIPNAFLLLALILYRKIDMDDSKPSRSLIIICCIISFFTCLLQEITAFTLCGTLLLLIMYRVFIEKKPFPVIQFVIFIFSILGAIIVCFGPGNLHRYENEVTSTLVNRVATNLDAFVATVFHTSNMPFLIVFLAFICFLSYEQYSTKKNGLPTAVVWLWSIAFIPLSLYYSPNLTLNILNYNYTVKSAIFVANALVYLGYASYLIINKLKELKCIYIDMFGLSGLLSIVSAFFYSNYIAHRMEICFYLSLYCIMLRIFSEENKCIQKSILFSAAATTACLWLSLFFIGYVHNYPIFKENTDVLTSAGARASAGEPFFAPEINVGYNHYYTVEFVYPGEPGCPDVPNDVRAMKEYYGLPEDAEIHYVIK